MRHHDHCLARLLSPRSRSQMPRRYARPDYRSVHPRQEGGLVHQRPRNGDALTFATGKLVGRGAADPPDQLDRGGPAPAPRPPHAVPPAANGLPYHLRSRTFSNTRFGKQVIKLENKPYADSRDDFDGLPGCRPRGPLGTFRTSPGVPVPAATRTRLAALGIFLLPSGSNIACPW